MLFADDMRTPVRFVHCPKCGKMSYLVCENRFIEYRTNEDGGETTHHIVGSIAAPIMVRCCACGTLLICAGYDVNNLQFVVADENNSRLLHSTMALQPYRQGNLVL